MSYFERGKTRCPSCGCPSVYEFEWSIGFNQPMKQGLELRCNNCNTIVAEAEDKANGGFIIKEED